jgi:hypothetical protein
MPSVIYGYSINIILTGKHNLYIFDLLFAVLGGVLVSAFLFDPRFAGSDPAKGDTILQEKFLWKGSKSIGRM